MLKIEWSNVFEFNENNVNKFVPDKSGVYRLSVGIVDGSPKIFYVGETESLKKRLLEHLSKNEPNECIKNKVQNKKTYFRFGEVSLEEDRKNAEFTMYHHFNKPECNKQEPEGKIIEMDFGN